LSTWVGGFHCTRERNAENVIWLYTCTRNRGRDGVFFPDLSADLASVSAASGVESAQAASIRACGSRNAANGYQSIVNITSRNVSCSQAQHIAFVIYREVGPDNEGQAVCSRNCVVRWAGWRITVHYFRWIWDGGSVGWLYAADVRSTASGGRVVHFQAFGE
jgi:hypothetical protein